MTIPIKTHSNEFIQLVNDLAHNVCQITPQELNNRLSSPTPPVVIDVTENNEYNEAHIANAIHLNRGIVERDIHKYINSLDQEFVIYCSGGYRGILTCNNLKLMGYRNVHNLQGGLRNWLNHNFAIAKGF